MNIDKVWFYNVSSTIQRQRWVHPFMSSFETMNDVSAPMFEMTNSNSQIGSIQIISPIDLVSGSNKYDRKTIDFSSIMKLINIIKKERKEPGNALVLDSDILCLTPLSEWERRIPDIQSPIIFLHRENNRKFRENNNSLPSPRENMSTGNVFQGFVGNMGAYILNKNSPVWDLFCQLVLEESVNQLGLKGMSDGTVLLNVIKHNPEMSSFLEIGTLEKTAKAHFYGKNIDANVENLAFFHFEADRKKPQYVYKIIRRAKKTKRLNTELSQLVMKNKWMITDADSIRPHIVSVCVDCSDFLEIALPSWLGQAESITIVTSPEDKSTISVCEKYNVNIVISTKKGPKFNRGAMLNDGFETLPAKATWILHLDSDIVLPKNFFQQIQNLDNDILYSSLRVDVSSVFELEEKISSKKRFIGRWDLPGSGYFQLFNAKASCLTENRRWYDESLEGCKTTDIYFSKKWAKRNHLWLPEFVFHLANHNGGINWFGRTSEKFV